MNGYVLILYTLYKCVLISKGKVNYKVKLENGDIRYAKPDKFILENDEICIVWQKYKGVEGSYRIYPHMRKMAKVYENSYVISEYEYGKLDTPSEYDAHVYFLDGKIHKTKSIGSYTMKYYEIFKSYVEKNKLSVGVLFYENELEFFSIKKNQYNGIDVTFNNRHIISYNKLLNM